MFISSNLCKLSSYFLSLLDFFFLYVYSFIFPPETLLPIILS